jgi:hypothetical protein
MTAQGKRSGLESSQRQGETQAFTLRLWRENTAAGQWEWRGALIHAVSGETRYFREGAALFSMLMELLEEVDVSL